MKYAWRLGRVMGVPLYWHWTFVPILAYLTFLVYRMARPIDWPYVGYVGMLIASLVVYVLLHELGHALTARYYGRHTRGIIFFPLGGGAMIDGMPDSRRSEALIYLAGPLVNLGVGLTLAGFLLIVPDGMLYLRYYLGQSGNFYLDFRPAMHLLGAGVAINLILFALNLLPAYPLDGGRILQVLARPRLGPVGADLLVATLGLILAGLLLLVGFWRSDWMLAAGAVFVAVLSIRALVVARMQWRLVGKRVHDLMRPLPHHRIYKHNSLESAYDQLRDLDLLTQPVFNVWNECVGFIALPETGTEKANSHLTVADGLDPFWTGVLPGDDLLTAAKRIGQANAYGAIVGEGGRVMGMLLIEDVFYLVQQKKMSI